ncbi:hypothetical protein Cob_v012097 [Colletotrichum orbiculare MAFF 240422]|uniref:Uncharacterized protein n=1 Tax=Colletotrichum orbiculare (strain 104-T / ATCC 96160 / CBS 514.97 / LARS 414 / MAFF 240422) TaxID=1213857 RepID=A0A484F9S2_COLOR|nr:hypothetical protein Cob_v012097 [Colletotrichum orbiculare MAFF 240422]
MTTVPTITVTASSNVQNACISHHRPEGLTHHLQPNPFDVVFITIKRPAASQGVQSKSITNKHTLIKSARKQATQISHAHLPLAMIIARPIQLQRGPEQEGRSSQNLAARRSQFADTTLLGVC